jgi:hypothetical protein
MEASNSKPVYKTCPTKRAIGQFATFRFEAFFRSKSFIRFVELALVAIRR